MALETIVPYFGKGGAKLTYQGHGGLKSILTEIQGLTFSTLEGTTKETDISVPNIATEDTVLYALALDPDNATASSQVLDVTSEVSITEAGKIQLSTTNTTGYSLVLVWYNKS